MIAMSIASILMVGVTAGYSTLGPLALNIQTFINLVGYGYENVWELGDVLNFDDPKVGWVASPA